MHTKLYSVTDPNLIADQFERNAEQAERWGDSAKTKAAKNERRIEAGTWRNAARMIRDTNFIGMQGAVDDLPLAVT